MASRVVHVDHHVRVVEPRSLQVMRTPALRAAVLSGADSVMAVEEDDFLAA